MSALVERLMPHLIVAPILLPMLAAALMLLLGEGRRPLKVAVGSLSALLGLGASVALLAWVDARGTVAYLPGNWPVPFGIALVADRLAVLMLLPTWVLGLCTVLFASARWHRAGVHFHPLVQLQLMGLSGAFLTGDLFNLFVFFEVLLAASYGLLLHGSGRARVRAGLHYVVINLAASSLFLIGASMLYGVTGTLNLAELSRQVAQVSAANRGLVFAAATILAVAFLIKAAAWPLNLWLAPAYAAATAPVAGLFAILTKVGVYALARLWTLLFSGGPQAGFGTDALLALGLVTAALASLGMVGAQRLGTQAAFSVVLSAGTLLAALGLGQAGVTGGALFYLVSSALSGGALLLVIDLVERWRNAGATLEDEAPFLGPGLEAQEVNLDDEQAPLVGWPFPASTAALGLAFLVCVLLVAGLPPLSSFVGKLAMLSSALGQAGAGGPVSARAGTFLAVLLGSGFLSLVALTRAGIRAFWSGERREGPRLRLAEGLPVLALLGACAALTAGAGPALRYTQAAAQALYAPQGYLDAVFGAPVRPSPSTEARSTR
ncbi:monovalent cation/H+ antiporter subunit D [Aggregicoccus sp. 17bor-14]|uniref:monovalent cation/H+ antiporter subunit D n=1 Tax=Myxococcaceae TaxID=31 RepID=UPI00129CE3DA|nr:MULTISPECIES: monovalent cation/H+ antiporter subunit D [Myxococcaceae]MBF5042889.1 monovalent cation/H+ antiporter subunit D [Simulacricoccus sp. 17bor-14]MRI88656.1 monovalent cation/H+ antiporter subunit D [Aggregicoccus sp. 17bor-14]